MKKVPIDRGLHSISRSGKIFRVMKLLSVFLICGSMAISAAGFSQGKRVTIQKSAISIQDLFTQLENKADCRFAFSNSQLNPEQIVSVNADDATVEAVLSQVLGNDLTYKVIENYYVIVDKAETVTAQRQAQQEQVVVKGFVKDHTGEPLPGVNIFEKINPTRGVISGFDGSYTIEVSSADAALTFSFIGFTTQEVQVAGRNVIDVTLVEETTGLDEVVVVAFGSQKKVNVTGSVANVTSEELSSRPVADVTQALQGIVPGMNFSYGNQGGKVGSSMNINIRGTGTLDSNVSNASPLVLIDGVEGDMNMLNPNDIESISVLKDAAASSIYGSRAPFGVVLITTKKGTSGSLNVNYNNNFRWSKAVNMPEMADSYTYAKFLNQISANDGQGGFFTEEDLQRIQDYQNGVINTTTIPDKNTPSIWWWVGNSNNDWLDEIFGGTGFSQEHSLSLNGGTEKTQYYLSANFMDQNGIVRYGDEGMQRSTFSAKLNTEIAPWLKANYSMRFMRKDLDQPYMLNNDLFYYNTMRRWPTQALYDPNGNLQTELTKQLMVGGNNVGQTDWVTQQLQFVIEPVKDWKTFAEVNYKTINSFQENQRNKVPKYNVDGNVYYDVVEKNSIENNAGRTNFFNTNIYSEYTKAVDYHTFKGMVGFQSELNQWRRVGATKEDLITEQVPSINTAMGTELANGNANHWATAGFFGRINYNYAERYLLEVNLRYDGTSRFGRDSRWNWFPSLSAGWNVAREEFFQDYTDIINTLKVRGSWGELGNQNTVNLYPYIQLMNVYPSSDKPQNTWLIGGERQNGASAPSLISANLGWETMQSWNVGLDLGMFRNRFTVAFDYFVRKTIDMVGPAPELPATLGTDVPKMNNTDMQSAGFELDMGWRDVIGNVSYGARVLLSDDRQKVLKYPNKSGSFSTLREGQYLGEIWGLTTIGIAQSQEEMEQHNNSLPAGGQNAIGPSSNWGEGDIMYADINNDGRISQGATINDKGDLSLLGNRTPRFKFGVDLDAAWKGFDMRLFFQGVAKRDWAFSTSNLVYWGNAGGLWNSAAFTSNMDFYRPADAEWMGANQDAYFPRLTGSSKNRQIQTRFIENAAYLRLKNLQLGYTFTNLSEKVGISKLRIFFSADNLFTVTGLPDGIEPETLGLGLNDTGSGSYPLTRVISTGLSVNF
ncbi:MULTISPECIES: TonB-dependent receptor [unclassified Carboxylicivirga]|uniref:TonB-dependent receptor n=1 Tax=Carboxylicivirga TaxID=1628153 RepID=UPI003D358A27